MKRVVLDKLKALNIINAVYARGIFAGVNVNHSCAGRRRFHKSTNSSLKTRGSFFQRSLEELKSLEQKQRPKGKLQSLGVSPVAGVPSLPTPGGLRDANQFGPSRRQVRISSAIEDVLLEFLDPPTEGSPQTSPVAKLIPKRVLEAINITEVVVSGDLRNATVFWTSPQLYRLMKQMEPTDDEKFARELGLIPPRPQGPLPLPPNLPPHLLGPRKEVLEIIESRQLQQADLGHDSSKEGMPRPQEAARLMQGISKLLQKAAPALRHAVYRRLKLRHAPKLYFKEDTELRIRLRALIDHTPHDF